MKAAIRQAIDCSASQTRVRVCPHRLPIKVSLRRARLVRILEGLMDDQPRSLKEAEALLSELISHKSKRFNALS